MAPIGCCIIHNAARVYNSKLPDDRSEERVVSVGARPAVPTHAETTTGARQAVPLHCRSNAPTVTAQALERLPARAGPGSGRPDWPEFRATFCPNRGHKWYDHVHVLQVVRLDAYN